MPVCKACGAERKLIQAHIIPKAWSPTIDQDGRPPKIISDNGFPKRAPIGIYDSDIVCAECEKVFAKLDDYATKALLTGQRESVFDIAFAYPCADRLTILKFVASLMLRANWSDQDAYRKVKLGSYTEKLRGLVFHDAPVTEIDVIISEYDQGSVPWFGPYKQRMDQARFWVLSAARFAFWIKVDQRKLPSEFSGISLRTGVKLLSVIREWKSSKQKKSMADLARKVQAKFGPLWKSHS